MKAACSIISLKKTYGKKKNPSTEKTNQLIFTYAMTTSQEVAQHFVAHKHT